MTLTGILVAMSVGFCGSGVFAQGRDASNFGGEPGQEPDVAIVDARQRRPGMPYAITITDEIDTKRLGKAFVIYQGHHGDAGELSDALHHGCLQAV